MSIHVGGGKLSGGNALFSQNVWGELVQGVAHVPSSRKVRPLHSGRRKYTQTETSSALPAQKKPV